ncbi:tRNA 2-methylthio-N6-isopentenyl adenosine(37) hydroxylase MiaE-like protein [Streptomyces sp. JJ66]|uniref:ferritin-like fold-containing protein n=1 Tax=Streptomyces sp. JJ66 TaxID=2803843 RepID=UPI001C5966A4|nr:ferritin-like fold-containing protein [Streptomyces sp. JJ66]MBW1602967.1 tRNA 2-methylthio-N6-isopentenyl adenosine(37) hydroxylase MiaE-like protein [Streptomyces sp. JJ66]
METPETSATPSQPAGSRTPGATAAGQAAEAPRTPGGVAAQDWAEAAADPHYREAVIDLLGALAYGELAAFERLAEDAKLAPSLADKGRLAAMASAEFHHFDTLRERLTQIDVDPERAMEPFVASLDEFHRQTAPSDWLEGLIKAYVGDSIASDFYREVAARLDSDTRALVLGVLDDTGHSSFAVERVRAAIEADPRVGGRLALWARRLMGEALSQAQRVVAERDALSTMLVGGVAAGFDLAEVGRMFSRITEAHTKRMAALGLAA